MATQVIMPKAGMDMQEGQIAKWHKSEGDYVEKGELLLEILTDKVNMEVEAEESGYLIKILRQAGDVVPVITTIAYLGEKDEVLDLASISTEAVKKSEREGDQLPSVPSLDLDKEVGLDVTNSDVLAIRATPKARKYAKEYGIDLKDVIGTQEENRISYDDVVKYHKNKPTISPVAKAYAQFEKIEIPEGHLGSGIQGKIMKADVLKLQEISCQQSLNEDLEVYAVTENHQTHFDREIKIQDMSNMRKTIASRMKQSYLESPVVHYTISVNMDGVLEFINENKKFTKAEFGFKLSVNDFIMYACARALMLHPSLNSSVDEEKSQVIFHEYVDLAMAVGLEEGLLTPIIRAAHLKSLSSIAKEARDLSKRAREMKLMPDELSGSTFTISNLGMYGIESFTPIINQPNTAILGVGNVVETPIVSGGAIGIAHMMKLSLSADHRVSDGVEAAKFMQTLKRFLESPVSLLF